MLALFTFVFPRAFLVVVTFGPAVVVFGASVVAGVCVVVSTADGVVVSSTGGVVVSPASGVVVSSVSGVVVSITDGVVVSYSSFGNTTFTSASFTKGANY